MTAGTDRSRIIRTLALLLLILVTSACQPKTESAGIIAAAGSTEPAQDERYSLAAGPRSFIFPDDHGPHPDFQTEWWYYTGNLQTADGRRFGYQLTFFRRALQPQESIAARGSHWGASQVYMAHFALSDIRNGSFHAAERLTRGAAGLAGAQGAPFAVWLEDWRVEESGAACPTGVSSPCAYRLYAAQDGLTIELDLEDMKGPVLQGQDGFSRKGPAPGQASYYYSLPRLATRGLINLAGEQYAVSGSSWMDHEFSTSALDEDQVGWDWFSMHFEDGSELMVFQIRRADGSVDPFSSGTWIAADGQSLSLSREDFTIQVADNWRSPHTGARYPARWTVRIPKLGLVLEIEPHQPDQELNLSYSYWEGAVRVQGSREGAELNGNGYVELTGYAESMGGEF